MFRKASNVKLIEAANEFSKYNFITSIICAAISSIISCPMIEIVIQTLMLSIRDNMLLILTF